MNRLVEIMNEGAAKAALAMEEGKCVVCEEDAKPRIQTEAGRREYKISGCCEVCFDEMFEDPTPWCHQCGAMEKSSCDCLPIAENN